MFIMTRAILFVFFLASNIALLAGTPGSFRGTLVEGPAGERTDGWVFVKGKNGMLRKVEIKRADIHYEEDFPEVKRKRSPKLALKPGIEVRVTANQDSDGEWHATEVEIVDPDQSRELSPDPDPNHRITSLTDTSAVALAR